MSFLGILFLKEQLLVTAFILNFNILLPIFKHPRTSNSKVFFFLLFFLFSFKKNYLCTLIKKMYLLSDAFKI
jgi:hypothetical protein